MDDREFMLEAISQAEIAKEQGEMPVGCVIVKDGQIIARGHNERETGMDPTAHAEIVAMRRAAEKLGSWRLSGCTLYVTLEPCPMRGGAIVNARLPRLVYAARDPRAGVFGSLLQFNAYPLNHRVEVTSGICEEESLLLLRDFFAHRRH